MPEEKTITLVSQTMLRDIHNSDTCFWYRNKQNSPLARFQTKIQNLGYGDLAYPHFSVFLPNHLVLMTSYSPFLGLRLDSYDGGHVKVLTNQREILLTIEKTYVNKQAKTEYSGVDVGEGKEIWNWSNACFGKLVQVMDLENKILRLSYGPKTLF